MQYGTIYLIPVPLAAHAIEKTFTPFVLNILNRIRCYIVEHEKTARYFLKQAGSNIPQSEFIFHHYGKHEQATANFNTLLKEVLGGEDIGLMSEAGCPGIADPGSELVSEAHRRGIKVVPLPGPSAVFLALMASGFSGQSFAFQGYLPIDKQQRQKKIKELEMLAIRFKQTQIFIEVPFRNNLLVVDCF